MIRIIEGVPGSGKSYYMVKYLSNFFKYDSFYDEYIVKDNVLIISNIEGLRVKHLDLGILIDKYGIEGFFTVANFEIIQKQYKCKNIILLIDEAQRLFDRKFYDTDVMYFFQYHRHLGVDIILGTQGANLLCNAFIPLCEFITEAVPRSKSIIGNFSYHFKDKKGKFLYSKVLRKDQTIFGAYKSFVSDEVTKPKNVVLHWAVISISLVLVGVICFKSALGAVKAKSEKGKVSQVATDKAMADKIRNPTLGTLPVNAPAEYIPPGPVKPPASVPPSPVSSNVLSGVKEITSIYGNKLPSIPLPNDSYQSAWVVVNVDGYVAPVDGSKPFLLALGVHQKVFRNYNEKYATVEIPRAIFDRNDRKPVATGERS
jgi:hypothetical protein